MEKYKSKIDDMTNEDIINELHKVRSDVQYLGEKLDRKRSWRDRLIRECWKRHIFKSVKKDVSTGEIHSDFEPPKYGEIIVGSEPVISKVEG